MTAHLAQQAAYLVKQALADAKRLEAAGCWVPFDARPTPEQLVETDILFFTVWLFSADGAIHPGEVSFLNAVLGRQDSVVSLTNQMQVHAKTLNSFSQQVPMLIECAIQMDQKSRDGAAKRMIEAFETIGLLALAADDQVSEVETKALTAYIARIRSVAAAILGPDRSLPPAPLPIIQDDRPAPSPPLDSFGKPRSVFGKRKVAENPAAAPVPGAPVKPPDNLDACRAELDALIGLGNIKEEVGTMINLLRIRQLRLEQGLPAPAISLHLVFTGNPGTGKTTVARLLGRIYAHMGILSTGTLIETDRSGLVGQYIGQTEVKTREAIDKAKGGILFIDEAYALAKEGTSNDFGAEAIAVLLKAMEDQRADLAVIAAGYPQPMQTFIEANPGLRSRFSRYFNFPDYSPPELQEIFEKMADDGGYKLGPEAQKRCLDMFAKLHKGRDRHFGNGRTARNAFEASLTRQANRLAAITSPSREQLSLLTAEDIATPMS
ncbi:ATPase, AAA family [Rhodospirillaceae bacterium LM-1]|nr:ATPase, AAA family [Rhodospirillaceae bacterium LM-1]